MTTLADKQLDLYRVDSELGRYYLPDAAARDFEAARAWLNLESDHVAELMAHQSPGGKLVCASYIRGLRAAEADCEVFALEFVARHEGADYQVFHHLARRSAVMCAGWMAGWPSGRLETLFAGDERAVEGFAGGYRGFLEHMGAVVPKAEPEPEPEPEPEEKPEPEVNYWLEPGEDLPDAGDVWGADE